MYDIFVIGENTNWKKIKTKYPFAKKVKDFHEARNKSLTPMFWAVWPDIDVKEDFDFTLNVPKWDEEYVHVWKNKEYYDGLSLVPKHKHISDREINYRFFTDKKEIDQVASEPKKYDIFEIETYEQYLEAMEKTTTDMFWMTSPNLKIAEGFDFSFQGTRYENHAFIHLVNNEKLYNGIFLLSKHRPVTKKEIEHRHIIERKEWDIIASGPCQYDIFEIETYKQYQEALENSRTEMFWMTSPNLSPADDFKFDIYFSHDKIYDRNENHAFVHSVGEERLYNGIFLLSKTKKVSRREIENRYIMERKEWDIIASGPCEYEKFIVDTYDQYIEAKNKSRTEMFWAIPSTVDLLDDFKFDLYFEHNNIYDRVMTHIFRNSEFYDGVMLITKNREISQKEFDYGFIVARKEYDVLASVPKKFDKFDIKTYQDYLDACEKSTTGMFWAVWSDVELVENFDFDYYVPRYNQHITHIFRNGDHFDGICLFSKHQKVSEKEFKYRFFNDKKEIDYIISYPKQYNIFTIETYEQYLEALEKSTTDLFWMTSPNLKVAEDFKFDLYITHHNAYERQENHGFIHRVGDEDFYNGIFLLSKHRPVTKKEIEHRYLIEKKEWDIVASGPCKYDIFEIETYEQYLDAMTNSKTELFWMTSPNLKIADDFKFDLYFDHSNTFDRNTNHVFVHLVNEEKLYNGVFLMSKHCPVTKKEIEHRYIVERKEWDIIASGPCQYEIFKADTYNEYLHAKTSSKTEMFYVVHSNIKVLDDFKFDLYFDHYNIFDRNITHIYRNSEFFDGVMLMSKHKEISQREFDYGFIVDRKEHDEMSSLPKKFDIFRIETYEQYLEACKQSTTGMFWAIWPDVEVVEDFDYDYYVPKYNQHITHVFRNGNSFDGICLLSKYVPITEKEFKYRFFNDKKEIDYIASYPVPYDKFEIETYEQYLEALENSTTDLFWMTSPNLKVADNFSLDEFHTSERYFNHAFAHLVNNEKLYNGVFLLSKFQPVTKKEIEHRYLIEKKEWDEVVSGPCVYDKFVADTYDQYLEARNNSRTEMFWVTHSTMKILDDFKFDLYFDHHNNYDRNITHVFKNSDFYDGAMLIPKNKDISKKEFNAGFIIDRKEYDILSSLPVKFDIFNIKTYQDYLQACKQSSTGMFWAIWPDVEMVEDFDYDYYVPRYNQHITHVFKNGDYFDGVCLFSKYVPITEKEFKYRFFNEKKEIDYTISYPKKYDIFEIETYEQYQFALENSTTDLFWMTSPNLKVADEFKFDLYITHHNPYERNESHAFIHLVNDEKLYNGIFLLSKNKPVTKKEIEHRYIIERKEWDVVASGPCVYDKFIIDSYDQYIEAKAKSRTEMFWAIPSDVKLLEDFKFDTYYHHEKIFERKTNHAFLNGVHYDGVYLLSKHIDISKKEFDNKFIIDRNETEIVASNPVQFDIHYINNYQDYIEACETSSTNMFWCVWPDVNVISDLDYYVPRYNQHITHIFKNNEYFDGICLFSKTNRVSEKEFKYRFFSEKKEIDIILSEPKSYDKFVISSYADYKVALETSQTDMFWIIPSEVEPLDNFKFDVYFSHHNVYDRTINHSYKHMFRGEETFNGICLMSKYIPVSEKEINFRYLVERKEWDVVASKMKPYDIIFISYNEINAEENFKNIKLKFDRVKRVHGVKGIHQAHIKAAELSETENFWVVDGDAVVVDDFYFDYEIPVWERDTVHVWRSKNPINDLVYGYGGIKLLPKQLTLNMDVTRPDMTTSISDKFKPVQSISNITAFNTDEFSTWKSAFRECAKLAGKAIDRQVDAETEERLNVWCTEGADKLYGEYAIRGAQAGRKFATEQPENLSKINDFDWLYEQYEKDNSK